MSTIEGIALLGASDLPELKRWLELYGQNAQGRVGWKVVAKQFEKLTPRAREVAQHVMALRRKKEPSP